MSIYPGFKFSIVRRVRRDASHQCSSSCICSHAHASLPELDLQSVQLPAIWISPLHDIHDLRRTCKAWCFKAHLEGASRRKARQGRFASKVSMNTSDGPACKSQACYYCKAHTLCRPCWKCHTRSNDSGIFPLHSYSADMYMGMDMDMDTGWHRYQRNITVTLNYFPGFHLRQHHPKAAHSDAKVKIKRKYLYGIHIES